MYAKPLFTERFVPPTPDLCVEISGIEVLCPVWNANLRCPCMQVLARPCHLFLLGLAGAMATARAAAIQLYGTRPKEHDGCLPLLCGTQVLLEGWSAAYEGQRVGIEVSCCAWLSRGRVLGVVWCPPWDGLPGPGDAFDCDEQCYFYSTSLLWLGVCVCGRGVYVFSSASL